MAFFTNISSKIRFKTWVKVAFACLFLLSLFGFASRKHNNMRVKQTDLYVEQAYDNYFIDEKDVMDLMTANGGEMLDDKAFKKLDLRILEKRVKENLFVDDVEVYRDVKGMLYVKVRQRKPIARITRPWGSDFYLDAKGNIFPISHKFTARVLVVDGPYVNRLLSKGFKKEKANQPYLAFIERLGEDAFLAAQIHQISIDHLGRINMYQQVGAQVIEFGYPDEHMDKKFKKLKVFYDRILPAKGWNAYKRVNLNFDNQIVCE